MKQILGEERSFKLVTGQRKRLRQLQQMADINMYQRQTAQMYRSTSKDQQNRVNEGYREEQNRLQKEVNKKKEIIQISMKKMPRFQQKKTHRT